MLLAWMVEGASPVSASLIAEDNVVWRMVVMPDTQKYTQVVDDMPIFNYLTQWMVDRKESWKLGLVLHEGDIVEHWVVAEEWQLAKGAISTLDGHLPYILATGNHDTRNGQPRYTPINNYFKASDNPLNDPAKGGILRGTMEPGRIENAYYEFTAPDGRNLLITSLEWSPRDATVHWADAVVSQSAYQNHTAILLTHSYLYHDGTRYDYPAWGHAQLWNLYTMETGNDPGGANDGEALWQKLVSPNPNYELVFNGHVVGDQVDRLTSQNQAGGDVHQMLFNAQDEARGGDGWLRILEFLDDGRTVHVRTYSPWRASLGLPAERYGDDYNFYLTLRQLGDLDRDGFVGVADLGAVLGQWGRSGPPADVNGDGFVGIEDLSAMLGHWNLGVAPGDVSAGELSGDGYVGIQDLTAMLSQWNLSGSPADMTGDGFVGIRDLNQVLGHWNAGTPPEGESSNVIPEPGSLGLWLGGAWVMRRIGR